MARPERGAVTANRRRQPSTGQEATVVDRPEQSSPAAAGGAAGAGGRAGAGGAAGSGGAPGAGNAGSPAARRSVGSYTSYPEAQRAVDFLSDREFPVERVSIVGHDLELVEQVTGRLTTARAALSGAGQGIFLGLLFALLFGLFFSSTAAFLSLLVFAIAVGALFGAVLGALLHAARRGERDFAAVSGMRANRYEVMVDEEVADEAVRLLGELTAAPAEPAAGSRVRVERGA
jgi:hypothetical protein